VRHKPDAAPQPSSAELLAATAGSLHLGRTQALYGIMKDPALRARLFDRLGMQHQSEGLEFFAAVLDRNRMSGDRMAATREIIRRYVVNGAPREISIAFAHKDWILTAAVQEDTSPMYGCWLVV
jgi:hypothetical protein